jgi:hypothetical protein
MANEYETAVATLYQAPHAAFVDERKRLAAELKAAGDKAGAAQLAKLGRPPISAWVVNQLWWHARDAFDALFAAAARLRDGDLGASGAHRDALAKLRARATAMLTDAGHGTTETTLRRVTQTLSALAAIGSFDPDLPGALAADRDPPGFEAVGIVPIADAAPSPPVAATPSAATSDERDATRRRLEEQRAKRAAERARLDAALRTAQGDVATRERDATRLRTQLVDAEHAIEVAKRIVADLEAHLAALGD